MHFTCGQTIAPPISSGARRSAQAKNAGVSVCLCVGVAGYLRLCVCVCVCVCVSLCVRESSGQLRDALNDSMCVSFSPFPPPPHPTRARSLLLSIHPSICHPSIFLIFLSILGFANGVRAQVCDSPQRLVPCNGSVHK